MITLSPKAETVYDVECYSEWYTLFGVKLFKRKTPKLKWKASFKNIVVTAGLNKLLDATHKSGFRVRDPETTPTINVTGGGSMGGSLQAGAYYLKYTFVNAAGETLPSTESSQFTVSSGNIPRVTLPALLPGAVSIKIYLTAAGGASNSETLYASGITATTYDLSAAQSVGAAMPSTNTAFMTPQWFVGLKGSGTPQAADTMGSHGSWSELVPYSDANRPQFNPGSIASGSVNNSSSKAVFNINGSSTIVGCFLTDDKVKSGTVGTLYGAGDFASSRAVANGDTLNVTVTLTQT